MAAGCAASLWHICYFIRLCRCRQASALRTHMKGGGIWGAVSTRVFIENCGYPRDAGVISFTITTPGISLKLNTHWSAPPVSALARSGGSSAQQARRGFSPKAAARHSQSARARTDYSTKHRLRSSSIFSN